MRRTHRRYRVPTDGRCLLNLSLAALMSSGLVFDHSQNHKDGTVGSANTQMFPGFSFEGSDNSVITCGNIGSIKTFIIWFKPISVAGNDMLLHLRPTADIFWVNTGTLTSTNLVGTPKYYVDGVEDATTVIAGVWQMMALTNATSMLSGTTDIGRYAASVNCTGVLAGVLAFSNRLNAQQILDIYNLTRHKYGT